MSRWPWSTHVVVIGLTSLCLGCGLADLFRPSGPDGVVLTYEGPTQLDEGDSAAFTIVARADGVVLSNPSLELTISNPSGRQVLALTASGDSIVGIEHGQGRLTARYHNSLLTGAEPFVEQAIQVKQGNSAP